MTLFWWRCRLDKKGRIVVCERVETQGHSGELIAYVQAATQAEARVSCAAWYRRHRERQNANAKALQARRRAAGECTEAREGCWIAADPGYFSCGGCREFNRERKRLSRQGLTLTQRRKRQHTPEEARAAYVGRDKDAVRIATAIMMFERLSKADFGQWLYALRDRANTRARQRVANDLILTKSAGSVKPAGRHAQH
jgi:hypothetical protein